MSKQNSTKKAMIQTEASSNSTLWNTTISSGSTDLGISAADLTGLDFNQVRTQTTEIKERIKAFEAAPNRESMNRVFKRETPCTLHKS